MTLLHKKIRMFRKTNQVLTKRRRIKKTYVRVKDVLTIKNIHNLIKQKEIVRQQLNRRSIKETIT